MKVETEILEDHQAKLTVTLSDEQLNSAKQQAARRISRNTKIPGFRPGKAPYPVVARTVGEAAVVEDALEILVDKIYPDALDEAGVDPYGPGTLENVESMDPPVFEFIVPLAPVVELGEYHEIHLPYDPPDPDESEIKRVIKELRESQAVIEHVDRPAEAGDIVYLTLSGLEAGDNGSAEDGPLVPERKMNILIHTEEEGSPTDEWPFPGFNQDLIQASAGDSRQIEYDFPVEDEAGVFSGKTVVFTARIDEVVSRELPELDDEFAQSVGEFESADELRAYVITSLQDSLVREYDEDYNQKLLDNLVEISTIDYPPQMTEHELEHMVERFEQQIAGMGMDLDVYLKTRDMTREDLEEEMRPDAEERILRSLALLEFIAKEEFEVDQEEVQEELERTIEILEQSTAGQPARSRPTYSREGLQNQLINRQIERAAFARLKAIATGELEEQDVQVADAAEEKEADPPVEDPQEQNEPVTAEEPKTAEVEAQSPISDPQAVEEESVELDKETIQAASEESAE